MPKEKHPKEEQPDLHPIPVTDETVRIIAEHHFKKAPKKFKQLTGGLANHVFDVDMGEEKKYIFRICELPLKMGYYLKEQWAVTQARERGVPVPEILEVGNEVVPNPYMIVDKVEGKMATEFEDKLKVLRDMGKYGAVINTIPTTGYGSSFDWSSNKLSKNETWKEFMDKEWKIDERLAILDENKMLSRENMRKIKDVIKEMHEWDKSPTLNHCDLRLKNMMVNDDGKIVAILDWENCASLMSPEWELSIGMHDLNVDEKEAFLEGYGIRPKDLKKMEGKLKAINILNYALHIRSMAERKEDAKLEQYRLRLNGVYDLYSIQ